MGFRGNVQFAVIQQWGDNGWDKGIEADNNEFNFNAPCRSNPCIANFTLVNTEHAGGTSTHGIHLRRGTDAQIYNSIIMGWKTIGIDIDAQCESPPAASTATFRSALLEPRERRADRSRRAT